MSKASLHRKTWLEIKFAVAEWDESLHNEEQQQQQKKPMFSFKCLNIGFHAGFYPMPTFFGRLYVKLSNGHLSIP